MNILLIIDPQNDFITGSLPVSGAQEAMWNLAKMLPKLSLDAVYVTMDQHPLDHCSFSDNGGDWPQHCIKYSNGAAIEPTLMNALIKCGKSTPIHFIEKATRTNKDEYSAFEVSHPANFDIADSVYIAGIAGDVCVRTSVLDLIKQGLQDKISIIIDAAPSLDGGTLLDRLIIDNSLKTITLNQMY